MQFALLSCLQKEVDRGQGTPLSSAILRLDVGRRAEDLAEVATLWVRLETERGDQMCSAMIHVIEIMLQA